MVMKSKKEGKRRGSDDVLGIQLRVIPRPGRVHDVYYCVLFITFCPRLRASDDVL